MLDTIVAYVLSQVWTIFMLVAALLLALDEMGFRFGLPLHASHDKARRAQLAGIQAAVLGLLSLLLGFTFAMAVNRYDTRRGLVVKEADAIGTTYLRAALLPGDHPAPVQDLLRRYVTLRLKYQALADDPTSLAEGLRANAELQGELWKHAVASAKEAPTPISGAFIASLNDTIDASAERLAAARANIPGGVWLLLILVSGFGCLTTGYAAGAEGARTALGSVFVPILITVVIVLIHDLSHPRRGLITISQQSLVDLQQTMHSDQP